MKNSTVVGLGASKARLAIYIANRPLNAPYPSLNALQPLVTGELQNIVANNSNHWRKAFNVFAKILWQLKWPELTANTASCWQDYRDNHLLQAHSREALLFSPPDIHAPHIKIITGKTYAAALALPPLTWLDAHFAVNTQHQLIVCPYLDYRQLSNARIATLGLLVSEHLQGSAV